MRNIKMTEFDIRNNIAELEARLFTAEKYINALIELNNLKIPPNVESELKNQRIQARKKYNII